MKNAHFGEDIVMYPDFNSGGVLLYIAQVGV